MCQDVWQKRNPEVTPVAVAGATEMSKSQSFAFTEARIASLEPAPAGTRSTFLDSKLPGFQVRVTSTGTKTFEVYRRFKGGRPKRVSLGRYPALTVDVARRKAQSVIMELADGVDPTAKRREQSVKSVTLRELLRSYLRDRPHLKPRTVDDMSKALDETWGDYWNRPLTSISPDVVVARHRKRSAVAATRTALAMRYLSALFNYHIGLIEQVGEVTPPRNPVNVLKARGLRMKPRRRQRYLESSYLGRFIVELDMLRVGRAVGSRTVLDYLYFLLLTGARREEAASLRWSDVDAQTGIVVFRDTKNRTDFHLPVSAQVQAMLRERWEWALREQGGGVPGTEFVFPSGRAGGGRIQDPRYQLKKLCSAVGKEVSPHDLRRTFSTVAEGLDFGPITLKRLLNHHAGHSDVTSGYVAVTESRLRMAAQLVSDAIYGFAGEKA